MQFEKPHRQEPVEPQLATMIDVFSILIIFLIAGSNYDTSSIVIPGGLNLPVTQAKDAPVLSAQIAIMNKKVYVGATEEAFSIDQMGNLNLEQIEKIKSILAPVSAKSGASPQPAPEPGQEPAPKPSLINNKDPYLFLTLIADKATPYSDIFAVMKQFRALGYKSLVLLGSPKKAK